MGLFDMIKEGAKKITNQVTGSYGKIDFAIDPPEVERGGRISYRIIVHATGDLEAKSVFIRLIDKETCKMTEKVRDFSGHMSPKEFTQTRKLYDKNIEVCGPLEMSEGETKEFTGEVNIPMEIQPTYRGMLAHHLWYIEAVLDTPWGKDLVKRNDFVVK